MRKYLPHNEYRLLKNRKSARLCRIKRKVERATLMSKTVDYEQLCGELRKELDEEKQRVKAIEDGSLQMREELKRLRGLVLETSAIKYVDPPEKSEVNV